jgi:hypothetical protein
MRNVILAFVAVLLLAVPAGAATVHGVVGKTVKIAAKSAVYPVKHPVKTLKAPVTAVVYVAKHL